jgi:hypothetical protein
MQPGGDGIAHPERSAPACQDQECRLKRVLRVVQILQNTLARPQNHCAMPLDERRECRVSGFPALAGESFQQLPVGESDKRAVIK